MPLNMKAMQKIRSFDLPVSYRINEARPRLRDALNVFSNQNRLETRHGRSVWNSTALPGPAKSLSFFRSSSGSRYLAAKVGTEMLSVASSGAHTPIKTGLSANSVHRGITWTRGSTSRQIYALESDGLFQWNGTSFTQLGQSIPASPSAVAGAITGSLLYPSYNVYLTYYSSTTGFESNVSLPIEVKLSSSLVVQDLTYSSKLLGAEGNQISIAYTAGATLGSEVVAVTNNIISVQIASGTTNANQIKTLIERSDAASALVSVTLTGTGTTGQVAAASTPLAGGKNTIDISSIPATAENSTIDTVRIYIKPVASVDEPLFHGSVALGTTTYTVSDDPTSTVTPPIANSVPPAGGGRYLLEFNRKLIVLGNSSFPNDVIMSEEDLPDAFNDGTALGFNRLYIGEDGNVTAGAVGLYNNSVLDPYLVIFKKRSIHIYSEIAGEQKLVCINKKIGCTSHDSVQVINGNVYFLSDNGWRLIENGRLREVVESSGKTNPSTLGEGDIDDIFRQPGYVYAVNRSQMSGAFSVYYSTLDQYMTWMPEGSSTEFNKTYVYEFLSGGFKPYSFYTAATCACIGEDSSGDEVVFMADSTGKIYTHSVKEARSDDDISGTDKAIDAFAMLTWMDGDDMDSTYNFRSLYLRRVVGSGDLSVKTWLNFRITDLYSVSYGYSGQSDGPEWDEAIWDEDIWTDERTQETASADINRTGENLLIGFYQSEIGSNINLISAQLEWSKNGNRN